ncbi:MAG: T9SS type A sorting domain-containing protein [Bacteroidetes bacterium]|nr:T9SS type A sorting domain-containing protein [Bacteroidota bacterium]
MATMKKFVLCVMFIWLLFPATSLYAYKYVGYRYTKGNFPAFYVNQAGTPDCSGEFTAIQNALQTWNNVNTTYVAFQYGGTTTTNTMGLDGTNLMMWVESGWRTIFPGSNAVAVNSTWYSGGVAYESDILFNGEDYTWSDNGAAGKYDVKDVATHEIGHSVGLDDLYDDTDADKTMYVYIGTGETKKSTLDPDDEDGARYVNFEAQTSGTLSEDQVWLVSLDGTSITVPGNLTIPSGRTLDIESGLAVTFSGYYKLRVEGVLIASGSPSSPVTFQGNGSSGSWFGIEFYNISSGSSLRYCTIKDASYGLNLISSSLPANPLIIRNNNRGVNCTNYSDPSFMSTVFDYNNWDVYGDGTSTPLLGTSIGPGYNSFRDPGYYQIYSTYSGTISAEGNWWGSSPAYPIVTSNVDYSNWLSVDPNPSMKQTGGKSAVVVQSVSPSSPGLQNSRPGVTSSDSGTTQLDAAYRLYLDGDYENALRAFETVTTNYPDDFAACRALVFAGRCLDKLVRSSDVLTELNDVSAAQAGTRVNTFAEARRTYQYLKEGKYQEALAQAVQIAGSSSDTALMKFALYDAGSIDWYDLGNKGDGEKYYRQLISRFPGDPLSASALVAMGETTSPSAPQQQASAVTEENQTVLGNYPNPFNPATVISYGLNKGGHVTLRIYDVLGKVVATLVDGNENAGQHSVQFNGQNLASGIYLYRLTALGVDQVKKMILMK